MQGATDVRGLSAMNKTISTLACVLGVAFTSSARADFAPEYELGVFGGAHLWNPSTGVGRLDSTEASQVDHGGLFGVRLGLGLHARFMIETELALAPSNTRGIVSANDPKFDVSARVLGIGYRLDGLVHILTGRFRPYVLVGIGGFSTTSSSAVLFGQDTTYSVGAGGGLKVDLTANWGLRLDGRALLHKGLPDGPALAPDGEVSLGIFGRFGDVKQKPTSLGVADRDKDGVTDGADLCPDVPGIPTLRGCPQAPGALTPPEVVPPSNSSTVPLPSLPPPTSQPDSPGAGPAQ